MQSLNNLNSYKPDQFEDWLRLRLIDQHDQDPALRRQAFDFRTLGIDRGESYLDDIATLVSRLDANAQRNFGVAVEQLLEHVQPGHFPAEGMTDLIRIAGDIQAFGALATIGHIVGNTSWGKLKPSLIYDTLAVMMKFEASRQQVYKSVKALATARHFQDGYAIDAYELLIRFRPENWLDDFITLQGRIAAYRRHIETSGDEYEISELNDKTLSMAFAVGELVPLSILGEQLATIDFAIPDCARLIRDLFASAGPLILRDKNTHWFVEDRAEPLRCAPLESENPKLLSHFQSFCIDANLVWIPSDETLDSVDPPLDSMTASFLIAGLNAELIRDACNRGSNYG